MSRYVLESTEKESKNGLIVSFGGMARQFVSITPFEFLNFLKDRFPTYDKHFYVDVYGCSYHRGFEGLSNNLDESVEYLREQIRQYQENDKEVVFIGNSSGGYAAILFGSLLKVSKVIAFKPQTFHSTGDKEGYRNLRLLINDTTKYYVFGDSSIQDPKDCHHISHCENLEGYSNVEVTRIYGLDVRKMRDSGELMDLFMRLIHSPDC